MTERRVHLLSHLFGRTSAITILNSDSNIARIIYLEGYYTMFCNGIALDDIASDIVTSFEGDETFNDPELLRMHDILKDYEAVKDRLCVRLMNLEKNTEFLADKYYRPYLDLAICLCVLTEKKQDRISFLTVTQEIGRHWDMPTDILLEKALGNSESCGRP